MLRLPLIYFKPGLAFLRLRSILVSCLQIPCNELQEEYLLVGGQSIWLAGIESYDSSDEFILILSLVVSVYLFKVLVSEIFLDRN